MAISIRVPSLQASRTVIHPSTTPKQKLPNNQLVFGKTFTDHMLEIDWDSQTGAARRFVHGLSPESTVS